jgi:hypothetical protein
MAGVFNITAIGYHGKDSTRSALKYVLVSNISYAHLNITYV